MLTRWLAFARGILRRQAIAREVDEELAFHLDRKPARHERSASRPAKRVAWRPCSSAGPPVVRSDVADVRTTWVEVVGRELRVGVRALAEAPSFTVPAVVVLALGIAATTTIVSVLDGVLLSPLPSRARSARPRLVEERRPADCVPFRLAGRLRRLAVARASAAPAGRLRTAARRPARRRPATSRSP